MSGPPWQTDGAYEGPNIGVSVVVTTQQPIPNEDEYDEGESRGRALDTSSEAVWRASGGGGERQQRVVQGEGDSCGILEVHVLPTHGSLSAHYTGAYQGRSPELGEGWGGFIPMMAHPQEEGLLPKMHRRKEGSVAAC